MHNTSKKKIIIRADGNREIGFGHITRSLALAEMLKENFTSVLAIYFSELEVTKMAMQICDEVISLPSQNIALFVQMLTGKEIVILDGYQFTEEDQKLIKSKGSKLVCIDDLFNQHMYADIVINHSLTASPKDYFTEPYTKVLTGNKYILLRKEFNEATKQKIKIENFNSAFVCFGGADKEDLAFNTLRLLLVTQIETIHLLFGAAYKGDLNRFDEFPIDKPVTIFKYQNLEPSGIVEVMRKCSLGIVSASNIAYECAAVGLPIITGYYLPSQENFYNALVSEENVKGVKSWLKCDEKILCAAIEDLEKDYNPDAIGFVDGNQHNRYIEAFNSLAQS